EAAERVNFAVEERDAEMVAAARQRRPRAPAIGCRIIDLVAGNLRIAADRSAESVYLAVEDDRADVLSRRRHRRLHGPGPRPLRRRDRSRAARQDENAQRAKDRRLAHHRALPWLGWKGRRVGATGATPTGAISPKRPRGLDQSSSPAISRTRSTMRRRSFGSL